MSQSQFLSLRAQPLAEALIDKLPKLCVVVAIDPEHLVTIEEEVSFLTWGTLLRWLCCGLSLFIIDHHLFSLSIVVAPVDPKRCEISLILFWEPQVEALVPRTLLMLVGERVETFDHGIASSTQA